MKKLSNTYSRFTVNGTLSNKIFIFDIDNTLLNSDAKIHVVDDNGNIVKSLTSEEFNNYVLPDNFKFDFSEFSDLKMLLKSKLKPYFEILIREYFKGTHISILTARGNFQMIKKFFLQKGIDIKSNLIFAVGSSEYDKFGRVSERKSFCIKKLISYGYKYLTFFDDDINNLKDAERVCKQFNNITIKTVHVK